MKISRKELKKIIREHLDEGMFDWVPPLAAKKRKPEKPSGDSWGEALAALRDKVLPALRGPFDENYGSPLFNQALELMKAMKAATPKTAMNENVAPIDSLEDLANLFAMRSQGGTVARFDPSEAKAAIALLSGLHEAADKGNAYAICTAQVGREDKEKYEKCVKNVAKKPGYHK